MNLICRIWENVYKNNRQLRFKAFAKMNKCQRDKIGEFLSYYIDVIPGHSYSDEDVIRQGIGELIKYNVFSVKQLQKEILRIADTILPIEFIQECARKRYR